MSLNKNFWSTTLQIIWDNIRKVRTGTFSSTSTNALGMPFSCEAFRYHHSVSDYSPQYPLNSNLTFTTSG
jgi:hypothetical protein